MSASNGSSERPLARAAERLRGLPGRPRKAGAVAEQADAPTQSGDSTSANKATVPGLCPLAPRLLDTESAARYLGGVSVWALRDLEAAGHLPRVRLPLPGGRELRRILYDVTDLDRLIERSKDTPTR
jgi:hypothetical protein